MKLAKRALMLLLAVVMMVSSFGDLSVLTVFADEAEETPAAVLPTQEPGTSPEAEPAEENAHALETPEASANGDEAAETPAASEIPAAGEPAEETAPSDAPAETPAQEESSAAILDETPATEAETQAEDPAEYVFPSVTVVLSEILEAVGLTLTQNNYNATVDNAAIALSADKVNKNGLTSFTLTASAYFTRATLTLASTNGKETLAVTLSYPAPKPEEKPSISYTFTDESDSVLLLNLLSAYDIYTTAIEDAFVSKGDADAVELLAYIGDYMVLPVAPFDTVVVTAVTSEGETYAIALHWPETEPFEQTITPELPPELEGTELQLSGKLPAGAQVAVECVTPAVQDEEVSVLLALDITIDGGFQPDEPILVTITSEAIAAAVANGEEIAVVHINDDGTMELAEIVSVRGDTVVFQAEHFSEFDLVSSIIGKIVEWIMDNFRIELSGFGVTATETTVEVEEGVELLQAYSITMRLISRLIVKISNSLPLGERESIGVYSIADGKLGSAISNLNRVKESFAVVRDSGFRRRSFELGNVALSGMVPTEATASVAGVSNRAASDGDYTILAAYDISLSDNGTDYQPDAEHPVEVTISNLPITDPETLIVRHIRDDGTVELIEDFTVEGDTVSFVATGFSIYQIGEKPENYRIGYRFYYYDGSQSVLLSTQYFRYKDVHPTTGEAMLLREPSIPGFDQSTWNRIFRGWSKSGFNEENDESLLTLGDLNSELQAFAENDFYKGEESEETVINLYANLKDVYYITYVDVNPNSILATDIVAKAESGDTTFTVKTAEQLHPSMGADAQLVGWYYDLSNAEGYYTPGQADVVLSGNLTLYPNVSNGYWLIFDDNDPVWSVEKGECVSGGASFTPPALYLAGEETKKPATDPTWAGHTFEGWYTDSEGTTKFSFGQTLNQNTTVYAKWTSGASSYRVIYWKQRATDDISASNDKKTYDYAGSRLVNEDVYTDDTVELDEADTRVYGANGTSGEADQDYFTYNAEKTDQTIVVKADGSSVLNVYYDRQTITISFTGNLYYYEETTDTTGELYAYINGEFVRVYSDGNGGYETRETKTYIKDTNTVYGGTRYNSTTVRNSNNPQHYGIVNGRTEPVTLYRQNNNSWYYYDNYWQNYNSTHYVINENGSYGYVNNQMVEVETRATSTPYTGTIYKKITQNNLTLTGLYGRSMKPGEWPTATNNTGTTEYWWSYYNNDNSNGTTTLNAPWNSYTIASTASNQQIRERKWNLFTGGTAQTGQKIFYYGEDVDGSYSILLAETARSTNSTLNIGNGKFYGYTTYGWRTGTSNEVNGSGWHALDGGNGTIAGSSNTNDNLYIYYSRLKYTLTFYTNNGSNQVDVISDVPYEKPLTEYANHGEGQRTGYYFVGWYADPSCTEPFDFSQTMPNTNVAVYGKWKLRRVRVVIEPGADNVAMGSQAKRFRVDYDELISGSLLETAERAGYRLMGWYTDPDFTTRFLFSNPVNDDITDIAWDYQDSSRWATARAAYGDDDEAHENVRGILHLYAKWELDTSLTGINVIYDPGDAAVYDALGTLLTTVPIDSALYAMEAETTAYVRPAPTNYNEHYEFLYWEATLLNGETAEYHPGDSIVLNTLKHEDEIRETEDEESNLLRYTVRLRAIYKTRENDTGATTITYDGNTFTESKYPTGTRDLQGKAKDGTQRVTITLSKEINETIELPGEEDFYLDGWKLVGWSFFEGSYESQMEQETTYNTAHPEDKVKHFDTKAKVAADNLTQNAVNDTRNTLYAMWQPKEYTVTVRQVIESDVPDNTFSYAYQAGVESEIGSAAQKVPQLTGNSQFVVTTLTDDTTKLQYYERVGHVFRIQTPTVDESKEYAVRVNAVVERDDGTTEILQLKDGNYWILGNVTITYTYSLKAEVKLQKRDATNHETALSGATFVMTPVEFNTTTNRWVPAGDGRTVTVNETTETVWLQEGTYSIVETTAPENYAKLTETLYLTIYTDNTKQFLLADASGRAIDKGVAELDLTGRILTMYDRPIRTVTLKKVVEGVTTSEARFEFTITVYESDGSRLGNYVLAQDGATTYTTDNVGEVTVSLGHNESLALKIPHGCKLTVSEEVNTKYVTGYQWNSESRVEDNVFGATPVEITANGALTFYNMPLPAPTGVDETVSPFGWLFGFGALLAALAMVGMLQRRRRREERGDRA